MPDGWVYIAVLEARGLTKKNGMGTRNAYVEVVMGDKVQKTDVCWKSLHPVWKKAGITIPVTIKSKHELPLVDVIVWDKNVAWKDVFLGFVCIQVNGLNKQSRVVDKWFQLKKKNEKRGEIHLKMRYITNRELQTKDHASFFEEIFNDANAETLEGDQTQSGDVGVFGDIISSANEIIGNKGKTAATKALSESKEVKRNAVQSAKKGIKVVKESDVQQKYRNAKAKLAELKDRRTQMLSGLSYTGEVIKRGGLQILGRKLKLWKGGYFMIIGAPELELRYFSNSSCQDLNKIYPITEMLEVNVGDSIAWERNVMLDGKWDKLFELRSKEKAWLFQAQNSSDKNDWANKIQALLQSEPANVKMKQPAFDRSSQREINLQNKKRNTILIDWNNLDESEMGEMRAIMAPKQNSSDNSDHYYEEEENTENYDEAEYSNEYYDEEYYEEAGYEEEAYEEGAYEEEGYEEEAYDDEEVATTSYSCSANALSSSAPLPSIPTSPPPVSSRPKTVASPLVPTRTTGGPPRKPPPTRRKPTLPPSPNHNNSVEVTRSSPQVPSRKSMAPAPPPTTKKPVLYRTTSQPLAAKVGVFKTPPRPPPKTRTASQPFSAPGTAKKGFTPPPRPATVTKANTVGNIKRKTTSSGGTLKFQPPPRPRTRAPTNKAHSATNNGNSSSGNGSSGNGGSSSSPPSTAPLPPVSRPPRRVPPRKPQ